MRITCETAERLGVAVGAQVGYKDLRVFGRNFIGLDPRSVCNDVLYQLGALRGSTAAAGIPTSYVKIHGALYLAAVGRASVRPRDRGRDLHVPVLSQGAPD